MTTDPHASGSGRFTALDGLRAFAIAAVIWHHSGTGDVFFGRGLGVTTMFAISGFIVTWLLLKEHERQGTIAAARFTLRRATRILPLYYLVLLTYVGVVLALERGSAAGAQFFDHLPRFATFTASDLRHQSGSRVIFMFAWSLSTQERLYLIWPWLVRLVRGRVMAVLGLAGLLTVIPLPFIPDGQATSIWLGSCLACVLRHPRGAAALRQVAGGVWSAPLAAVAVLVPLAWPGAPQVLTVLALAYLVAACAVRPGLLAPILTHPVTLHVGKVSYGMYLMHMLCMNVARRLVPGAIRPVLWALTFALTALVATASYKLFESPLREYLMRRLSRRPTSPPSPEEPSPSLQAAN